MNTSYTRIDAEEIPNWACYNDNRIAVIDSLQNFDSVKVVKMGFYMFVLCLKGDASFVPSWTVCLPLISIILSWLAIRAIGKDEMLVKAYERLR